MHKPNLEDIEVDLFVEAMHRCHGYDFSHYARASLKRRVLALPSAQGCKTVSELIPLVVH
jgi:chemotaxis protein methyltransferase CheR